jgi:hypothetical protein
VFGSEPALSPARGQAAGLDERLIGFTVTDHTAFRSDGSVVTTEPSAEAGSG